jgi:transposase
LHKYLYSGWKPASELRFKILGRKTIVYMSFTKSFEVSYNPRSVVAVDINENNVTVALFKDGALADVYRVETNLGRTVVAYSERRKRKTLGRSTKVRETRKKLRRLREKERKLDVLRRTARFIEELAVGNRAVVVIGNIGERLRKVWRRMLAVS